MKNNRVVEFWVGILFLLGLIALFFLALRVSGLALDGDFFGTKSYNVSAEFNNIGSLKPRSPVRMAGVEIGTVQSIELDPKTYWAKVEISIKNSVGSIPEDSIAKVTAAGLLGDNYVEIQPGASSSNLKAGDSIQHTYGATDIISLLGTFAHSMSGGSSTGGNQQNSSSSQSSPFKPITSQN